MTKTEAITLINQIEQICKERGIWFCLTQEHRPLLDTIRIKISIEIDNKK